MNQPTLIDAANVAISPAAWTTSSDQIEQVRRAVFIEEQGVPAAIEMDGQDPLCHHLLAVVDNQPVGTVRLLSDGRIGRLAVLKKLRGQGIGRKLLLTILETARSAGLSQVHLHAQTHALEFYRNLGFQQEGDEFVEASIPHINMTLDLANTPQ